MATVTDQVLPTPPRRPPQFHDVWTLEEFQKANELVFPSIASLEWFERINRAELLKAGAIVELAGRKMVRGQQFIAAALDIGTRRAAARRRARTQP